MIIRNNLAYIVRLLLCSVFFNSLLIPKD